MFALKISVKLHWVTLRQKPKKKQAGVFAALILYAEPAAPLKFQFQRLLNASKRRSMLKALQPLKPKTLCPLSVDEFVHKKCNAKSNASSARWVTQSVSD